MSAFVGRGIFECSISRHNPDSRISRISFGKIPGSLLNRFGQSLAGKPNPMLLCMFGGLQFLGNQGAASLYCPVGVVVALFGFAVRINASGPITRENGAVPAILRTDIVPRLTRQGVTEERSHDEIGRGIGVAHECLSIWREVYFIAWLYFLCWT